ncbi:MAG: diacylglycerol kinase family lipid kinase [Acidobacteria bacterium]|nr:diacylglycerol kinase family lipid kinase [Acidobacteriota bacterium]
MSTVAIFNPKSGSGKAAQTWAKVSAHLRGQVEALETKAPGHAIELAANAIKGGATTIIAVGGDGTINEVVNGFFENEHLISGDAALGIIPYGTGSDFSRILNLPADPKKMAAVIENGERRMIDLLQVCYTRMDGAPALRYSINITSFGMGGRVAARVSQSPKRFGAKIAYMLATLQTALSFPGNNVTLRLGHSKTIAARITNVAVGNGQYHGAGMWMCPGASIEDGLLDVTVIQHLSPFELVKSLPLFYNGGIYGHRKVESYRVKHVKAESEEPAFIEVDGEPLGRLPVEISILPRTLRILVP